jgi:demethylmenaquinone methyltransferase/2-methoxy-6-polyprenyl-1,4-benzoquinol methylase
MSDKVNFGFKKIDKNIKQNLVGEVFSSVAHKYDLMNDVMSLGIHRLWKRSLIQELLPNKKLIDMASGTGDIATLYYNKSDNPDITLCDINLDMLSTGKDKLINNNIFQGMNYVCCNAEVLPFEDLSYDYYTIAFGIRNVTNIGAALKEAWRVLKPGGKFVCLEFARVNNKVLAEIYNFYSLNIIPKIGNLIVGDKESYKYLVESIRTFPAQEEFVDMMNEAGFHLSKYKNFTNGVVALYTGYKV